MSDIRYITRTQKDRSWGLTVGDVGHQRVLPGESYPPSFHEQKYMFNPNRGRVLSEYQIVYIVEGAGVLKTLSGGDFIGVL